MKSSQIAMRTTFFFLLAWCSNISGQDLSYRISEERLSNTFVGNIANDSDLRSTVSKDVYDQIRYNILKEISISSYSYFKVDNKTGSLYTASVIDRESITDCTFSLKCVLKIKVAAQSIITAYFRKFDVSIEIEDINDNSPRFPKESIDLELSESTPLGSSVPLIGAVDIDSGNFSIKKYYIIPSASPFDAYFQNYVDGTSLAKIVVRRELDREIDDSYTLTVVVEDGGMPPLSDNLTVNIVITDVNDNAPHFTKSVYNITVEENATIGTLLVKLEAMDSDMGQNGEVIYRLSHHKIKKFPELVELFGVHENSGELRLKGPIVFDTPETKYEVIVEASDKGVQPLFSQAIVQINVIDFNNNPPDIIINFLGDHGAAIISEYAVEGTAIAYIEVLDKDTGISAVIECNIASDVFELQSIDFNEYKVIVKTVLDRETVEFHNVTLFCEDEGTPPLNSSTSFIVQVKDENDNRPIFNQEIYIVDINENITGEYKLIHVSATDADVGINSYVHYTVGPSNYHIYFDSDGNIWTSSVFDRETESRITFSIFAIDRGIPAFTSTSTIVINVQDTNDNDPYFSEKVYQLEVAENLPIDTNVGQITVTDQDIGKNGEISLIIDGHFPFAIDSFGVVKTSHKLDREIESKYNFTIIAFDHGVPSRSSTCSIDVNIADMNDNSPIFVFPSVSNNTVVLRYPSSPWAFVSQINAYDLDDGPNGQMLYSLVTTNVTDLFIVREDSGEIFLLRELTLADKTSYYLPIRIDDQGQPSNFATEILNVMITFSVGSQKVNGSWGENLFIAVSVGSITFILMFIIMLTICLLKIHGRKSNTNHVADSGLWEKDAKPRTFRSVDIQISDLHNETSNDKTLNGDQPIIHDLNITTNCCFVPDTKETQKSRTPRYSSFVYLDSEQPLPTIELSFGITSSSPKSTPQRVQETRVTATSVQITTLQSQQELLQHFQTKVVKYSYEDNDSQTSGETIQSDSGRGGSDSDMYSPRLLHAHCENINSLRNPGTLYQSHGKYQRSSANTINHLDTSGSQVLIKSYYLPYSRNYSDFTKRGSYKQRQTIFDKDSLNNHENNVSTFLKPEDVMNHSIVTQEEADDDLSTTTSGSYTFDLEEVYYDYHRLRGSLV